MPSGKSSAWIGYAAALAGVVVVSVAIGAVLSVARIANVSMLYLLVVLAVATRFVPARIVTSAPSMPDPPRASSRPVKRAE